MITNLKANEIIFLKYLSYKPTNIEFSTRWQFQYGIEPISELKKLKDLNFIVVDNDLTARLNLLTITQLKNLLSSKKLSTIGKKNILIERIVSNVDKNDFSINTLCHYNIFKLTFQGEKAIEENKRLFMTDREKAGSDFEELKESEYNFLKTHHCLKLFLNKKAEMCSNGHSKNDVLWYIYNELILKYMSKKDYFNLFLTYNIMFEHLYSEKKFEQATQFLIIFMYLRMLDINKYILEHTFNENDDIFYYERHIKKYSKTLAKYIEKSELKISTFSELKNYFEHIITHHLPSSFINESLLSWLAHNLIKDII